MDASFTRMKSDSSKKRKLHWLKNVNGPYEQFSDHKGGIRSMSYLGAPEIKKTRFSAETKVNTMGF